MSRKASRAAQHTPTRAKTPTSRSPSARKVVTRSVVGGGLLLGEGAFASGLAVRTLRVMEDGVVVVEVLVVWEEVLGEGVEVVLEEGVEGVLVDKVGEVEVDVEVEEALQGCSDLLGVTVDLMRPTASAAVVPPSAASTPPPPAAPCRSTFSRVEPTTSLLFLLDFWHSSQILSSAFTSTPR